MSEMETELSTRLRSRAWEHRHHRKYREEAADRIADLERKLKVAEEALDKIAGMDKQYEHCLFSATRVADAALSTIREG